MKNFLNKILRKKSKKRVPDFKKIVEKEGVPELVPEAENVSKTKQNEENFKPWIGVDLDGTLAEWKGWKGIQHIGKPIPLMLERVKFWTKNGIKVKILTARAGVPEAIPPVKKWLEENGVPELEITDKKDFSMVELWDDRAIQVVQNTGKPFLSMSSIGRPAAPILPCENADSTFFLLKKNRVLEEEKSRGNAENSQ